MSIKGCKEARKILRNLAPNVLFSKGGYVSFPVVYAAHHCKIPAIIHESDLTPGLANKLSIRYASTICTTFPATKDYIHQKIEIVESGPIVRDDLLLGRKVEGRKICNFKDDKPTLLVMGGSMGAEDINNALRSQLGSLLCNFNIIHLCGKGHFDADVHVPGYCQFEYVSKEMPDLLALSDIVISRAGANSIFELLSVCKPMLLIPLPTSRSRGDQIQNAKYFEKLGYAEVLDNENCALLTERVLSLYNNRHFYIQNMSKSTIIKSNSIQMLAELIMERS